MTSRRAGRYIDVHLHFEGAIPAEFFLEHSELYPGKDLISRIKKERYADFSEFAECWCFRIGFLNSPEMIYRAASSLAEHLEKKGVHAVIMHFSPDEYTRFGIPEKLVAARIIDGFTGRKTACALILDCVRNNGPDHAARMVSEAVAMQDLGVIGIGLGGDETILPAREFRKVFSSARSEGLFTTAHCGEMDIQSVVDAVEVLQVNRIVHGYLAAEDNAVLQLLKKRQVAVEVCLTSYERMYGGNCLDTNPLAVFVLHGLDVTLGSDDPDMFNTDIAQEYSKAAEIFKKHETDQSERLCEAAESWAESAGCHWDR